jgi:hypothetical protein
VLKLTSSTEKVYFPVLFDREDEWIADGMEFPTQQEAENHASAMVGEYVEEVGEYCYARIDVRIIPIYTKENV